MSEHDGQCATYSKESENGDSTEQNRQSNESENEESLNKASEEEKSMESGDKSDMLNDGPSCTDVPHNKQSAKLSSTSDASIPTDIGKGEISWTDEGAQYRVSWTLPKGTATTKDYVALCFKVAC
ncbi:unnamed protein product [Leptosia nina]|uniref:Uncharacterized protein n=1 Tax=Leptosia nina TaxID=320188 RepID=A0AAV1JAB3_9NEOP